jgi:hypothetical protein
VLGDSIVMDFNSISARSRPRKLSPYAPGLIQSARKVDSQFKMILHQKVSEGQRTTFFSLSAIAEQSSTKAETCVDHSGSRSLSEFSPEL